MNKPTVIIDGLWLEFKDKYHKKKYACLYVPIQDPVRRVLNLCQSDDFHTSIAIDYTATWPPMGHYGLRVKERRRSKITIQGVVIISGNLDMDKGIVLADITHQDLKIVQAANLKKKNWVVTAAGYKLSSYCDKQRVEV